DDRDSEVSEDFDDRNWVFTGSTENVSGKLKSIPDIPIVTMATDTLRLRVGSVFDSGALVTQESDYLRWNDYGIALLRQGHLRAAERAFKRVTEINPSYADGWVNLARAYLQEGDLHVASETIAEAEVISPGFYKARYFRALIARELGDYDRAIEELTGVARRFPLDRVVRGQLGRVYYLGGHMQDAAEAFEQVLKIDPEDVGAHYNLMLIRRTLGNEDLAREHELRYDRFKDDESAPAVSNAYRQVNPFDNNESLPVHEHADGSSKR
ncbi:MAG: tetratricopeptide repeat protein, partial [Rhodothermia bacterium]